MCYLFGHPLLHSIVAVIGRGPDGSLVGLLSLSNTFEVDQGKDHVVLRSAASTSQQRVADQEKGGRDHVAPPIW